VAGSAASPLNPTAQVGTSLELVPGQEGPVDRASRAVQDALDYIPDTVSSNVAEYAGKKGVNPYVAAAAATPLYLFADPLNYTGEGEAKSLLQNTERISGLAMDQGSRFKRAAEMGFDTAKKWFHGTGSAFNEFKDLKGGTTAADSLLYGPGTYFTSSPNIAGQYAENAGKPYLETLAEAGTKEEAFKQLEQVQKKNKLDPRLVSVTPTDTGKYLVQGILHENANVVPVYLKHGELFRAEDTISPHKMAEIIDAAGINRTPEAFALQHGKPNGIRGSELYRYMVEDVGMDRTELNKALAAVGYNGIEHKGGQIMGKEPHTVRVIFDPRHVRSVNAGFDLAKQGSANLLASVTAAILGGTAAGASQQEK
jgi:hypothetical protein